jgi:hypothetical protein
MASGCCTAAGMDPDSDAVPWYVALWVPPSETVGLEDSAPALRLSAAASRAPIVPRVPNQGRTARSASLMATDCCTAAGVDPGSDAVPRYVAL